MARDLAAAHRLLYETLWLDADPRQVRFTFQCSCGHTGEEHLHREDRDRDAAEHWERETGQVVPR